jgi:amino acid transporter/Trk K+ transport system NAD-binding subunit
MTAVAFKRDIGLFVAVMIGIGAMMGPGIFALPGELAHMVGPLGVFAYLAMGLLVCLTALSYSELGAAIPLAGGGYSFAHRVLPRPVAFLAGWLFWIGNTLACAMYVVIFALTVRAYFWPSANIAAIALTTTIVFGLVNLRGMSAALKLITVMNVVELAVLVGVAAWGSAYFEQANYTPLAPEGFGPFLPAMALISISYVGFDLITVAAEEIIDPARTIPRAIFITMGVGIVLYFVVVGVMFGVLDAEEIAGSDVPFILVAEHVLGPWGRWAGIIATIMASLSAFSVTLGASARVLFALGRDKHFPAVFTRVHKRYQTPHIALLACVVIVGLTSASGIVKFIASVADFGYLLGLGIVNYAAFALRRKMPNLRRPFKMPLSPYLPIAGMVTCWAVVPFLEVKSLSLGAALVAVGTVLYLSRSANRAGLPSPMDGLTRLRRLLSRKGPRMRVLIIGGSHQGQSIAERLLAKDEHRVVFRQAEHQLTFVEEDEDVCDVLEKRFSVPVFQGDGTKQAVLQQVGRGNIDVAVAATNDDGQNVIAALQAKRMGIDRVIAIVQDQEYLPLLKENDVVVISAPWATAAMVENFLDRPGVSELFDISGGDASLVGMVVPENAVVAGQAIKDIAVPKECVVSAIIRRGQVVVPRGETVIEEADHVVFVGPSSANKTALDLFTQKPKGA